MVQFKHVKVTVIRYDDKKPYHEYRIAQNATMRARNTKEAYVEAVSGERFAVVVEVLPAFDFKSAPFVRIKVAIDGLNSKHLYIRQADVNGTHDSATSKKECRVQEDCTREIDGRWMRCGLVFAELQLGICKIYHETCFFLYYD